MKIHAQEILKRNVQFILFIVVAVICTLSVVVNLVTLAKVNQPTLIAIDANGTRIVSADTDPIFRTEAISFIQKFVFYSYNFDTSNFLRRVGAATSLMSEDLWHRKRSEILALKEKVSRDEITLIGQIEKLTVDEDGSFHALINVNERSRLNENEHQIKVHINLARVERSYDNPFGMEVDSYEETLLRD